MRENHRQGRGHAYRHGLRRLAFYDAIRANDSAVALGDGKLKQSPNDLVEIVRRGRQARWNVKEQVRAKLGTTIKRLLRKHGYPPDKADPATDLVLQQAEVLATEGLKDEEYV